MSRSSAGCPSPAIGSSFTSSSRATSSSANPSESQRLRGLRQAAIALDVFGLENQVGKPVDGACLLLVAEALEHLYHDAGSQDEAETRGVCLVCGVLNLVHHAVDLFDSQCVILEDQVKCSLST